MTAELIRAALHIFAARTISCQGTAAEFLLILVRSSCMHGRRAAREALLAFQLPAYDLSFQW